MKRLLAPVSMARFLLVAFRLERALSACSRKPLPQQESKSSSAWNSSFTLQILLLFACMKRMVSNTKDENRRPENLTECMTTL
jgi:hypothetical protein